MIESGGFGDVDSFIIENGDILDLTTTGLKNLQAVEKTNSEELLNYKIQLNGPVNGLVNEVVTQLTDDRVAYSVLNTVTGTIFSLQIRSVRDSGHRQRAGDRCTNGFDPKCGR